MPTPDMVEPKPMARAALTAALSVAPLIRSIVYALEDCFGVVYGAAVIVFWANDEVCTIAAT